MVLLFPYHCKCAKCSGLPFNKNWPLLQSELGRWDREKMAEAAQLLVTLKNPAEAIGID